MCVCMMSSAALCLCVQLAPVLQNTLGHEQGTVVPEPGLHKDELDSILGDVSEIHSHECEYDHQGRRWLRCF